MTLPQIGNNESLLTVRSKLNASLKNSVSMFDYIPSSEWAAIESNSSSYDIFSALTSALADIPANHCGSIIFPFGGYKCSQTVHLKKQVNLIGEASGFEGTYYPTITWPSNIDGMVIHRYNTGPSGIIPNPGTTPADGTVISGLGLVGGFDGVGSATGLKARARTFLHRSSFAGFSGVGCYIIAFSAGDDDTLGNANNFRVDGCSFDNNGSHGFFVDGDNANAGLVTGSNASFNGGFGFFDSSFLGNTYIALHVAANVGGAYKTDAIASRSLFMNCYSESGQPPAVFEANTMVIGGQHAAGFSDTSKHALLLPAGGLGGGLETGLIAATRRAADGSITINATLNGNVANGDVLSTQFTLDGHAAIVPWLLKFLAPASHEDLVLGVGNVAQQRLLRLTGEHTNFAYGGGRPSSAKYVPVVQRLGLSDNIVGNDGIVISVASAVPTSGEYGKGDRILNANVAPGGVEGWVCTTGGTAGVDAVFKTFGLIGL